MEAELRELEKRAFSSWEREFTPNLMISNKLIRVGCATFTMKKAKHRKPHVFKEIMDDYFRSLARRQGRHFVWVHGMSDRNAPEKTHQHGDIYVFYKEGVIKDIKTFRWLLEARFNFGRCEVVGKHKELDPVTNTYRIRGNWTGYSVAKHDGNDDFLKVYCPRTGPCGDHTKRKGDRRTCVYQRTPIKLK